MEASQCKSSRNGAQGKKIVLSFQDIAWQEHWETNYYQVLRRLKYFFSDNVYQIDNKDYEVLMNVQNMSFSAHADSKGIIQLIKHLQPKNVMFVHGEAQKMKTLGKIIYENLQIPVHCPENF